MHQPKMIAKLELDLDHLKLQMDACFQEMVDGIDYDWNQDEFDRLEVQYNETQSRLNMLRILR